MSRRIDMRLDSNRKPLRQWRFLLLSLMMIGVITRLVIYATSNRPSLQGGVSQPAPDGQLSDRVASSAFGQTPVTPIVDHTTLWVDSVKRGPIVWLVRGFGVLVRGDAGRLKAELRISEPQARNIESGQPVSIETRMHSIPGKVVGINPRVINRLVAIEVSLEGDLPKDIKAGLEIDGTIEVGRSEDVVYLARPIHGQADSTSTLFKLAEDGRTATRVRVKFGQSSIKEIEIVDGLKVGDKVILSDMSEYEGVAMIRLN